MKLSDVVNGVSPIDMQPDGALSLFSVGATEKTCELLLKELSLNESVFYIHPPQLKDALDSKCFSLNNVPLCICIKTREQLDFFLQVIQAGLIMKIDDHFELVKKCVYLASFWLKHLLTQLDSDYLPKVTHSCSEATLVKILGDLLLFFKQIEFTNDQRHSDLCILILEVISEACSSNLVELKLWNHVLDFLLCANSVVVHFCKESTNQYLCGHVSGTLFPIWLHAALHRPPSSLYWTCLERLFAEWRGCRPVLESWSVCVCWLTALRIKATFPERCYAKVDCNIRDLYPCIKISMTKAKEGFLSDSKALWSTWYRLLVSPGNPKLVLDETTRGSGSFSLVVRTLATVSDMFLGIETRHTLNFVRYEHGDTPWTSNDVYSARVSKAFKTALVGFESPTLAPTIVAPPQVPAAKKSKIKMPMLSKSSKQSSLGASSVSSPSMQTASSGSLLTGSPSSIGAIVQQTNPTILLGFEDTNLVCCDENMDQLVSMTTFALRCVDSGGRPPSATVLSFLGEWLLDATCGENAGRAEALGALCRLMGARLTDEPFNTAFAKRLGTELRAAVASDDFVILTAIATNINTVLCCGGMPGLSLSVLLLRPLTKLFSLETLVVSKPVLHESCLLTLNHIVAQTHELDQVTKLVATLCTDKNWRKRTFPLLLGVVYHAACRLSAPSSDITLAVAALWHDVLNKSLDLDLAHLIVLLELMTGMAGLPHATPDTLLIKWLDWVVKVITRECQRHSVAHTALVACFSTLTHVCLRRPRVLTAPDLLSSLLAVAHLGLAGSGDQIGQTPMENLQRSSLNLDSSATPSSPLSGRVSAAAEMLLAVCAGTKPTHRAALEGDIARPEDFVHFVCLKESVVLSLMEYSGVGVPRAVLIVRDCFIRRVFDFRMEAFAATSDGQSPPLDTPHLYDENVNDENKCEPYRTQVGPPAAFRPDAVKRFVVEQHRAINFPNSVVSLELFTCVSQ